MCDLSLKPLVVGKDVKAASLDDLPLDLLRPMFESMLLRRLAVMACYGKVFRTLYVERVQLRDEAVAARLTSDFSPDFRERLTADQTRLPRDLMVEPMVRV
jgi:hypothetical protein